jgi:predicted CXXCH cytochrome family protein
MVLRYVFPGRTTCGECHYYETKEGKLVPEHIKPPKVPQLWYPHAKFSHYAHRAVDCSTCHKAAESTTNTDVLLPGIENCLKCHSARRTEKGETFGGVRQDCTTCHRYHQGDVPEAGLGARARGPKEFQTIEQFLNPGK